MSAAARPTDPGDGLSDALRQRRWPQVTLPAGFRNPDGLPRQPAVDPDRRVRGGRRALLRGLAGMGALLGVAELAAQEAPARQTGVGAPAPAARGGSAAAASPAQPGAAPAGLPAQPTEAGSDRFPGQIPLQPDWTEWASGRVLWWQGAPGDPGPENIGRAGTIVVLAGPKGSLVWNGGPTRAHGAAVRATLPAPARAVAIGHPLPELIFGVGPLQEGGAPLWMSQPAAALMQERCGACLERFQRMLGPEWMRAAQVPRPDHLWRPDQDWTVSGLDRGLRLVDMGWASAPGSVVLHDGDTRTALVGGLVMNRQIADIHDADLAGWLRALPRLDALFRDAAIDCVVPDHGAPLQGGPAAARAAVKETRAYLLALSQVVDRSLDAGDSLLDILDGRGDLPAYRGWQDYALHHPRNLQTLFLAREARDGWGTLSSQDPLGGSYLM